MQYTEILLAVKFKIKLEKKMIILLKKLIVSTH